MTLITHITQAVSKAIHTQECVEIHGGPGTEAVGGLATENGVHRALQILVQRDSERRGQWDRGRVGHLLRITLARGHPRHSLLTLCHGVGGGEMLWATLWGDMAQRRVPKQCSAMTIRPSDVSLITPECRDLPKSVTGPGTASN